MNRADAGKIEFDFRKRCWKVTYYDTEQQATAKYSGKGKSMRLEIPNFQADGSMSDAVEYRDAVKRTLHLARDRWNDLDKSGRDRLDDL